MNEHIGGTQANFLPGGVCAAKGFRAAGVHCGVRRNKTKRDLALVVSDTRAAAAAVYTTNVVKGAPLTVTRAHLQDGHAQAMLCNSGNANTCNANGIEIAEGMCQLLEQHAGVAAEDVIVASTGVIGQPMSLAPFVTGVPMLAAGLSRDASAAAEAIMTTDTFPKEAAVAFSAGGKTCVIGGMAKGSGMIHPNMATLLVFLTTDAAITPELLRKAISEDVKDTFNMVTVDGDMSTNDMLSVLANGAAGNAEIAEEGADFDAFRQALRAVTGALCPMIAMDGEGATKLMTVTVAGAATKDAARKCARSVAGSALFKAALFGADANWGRVLCAMGYSGATFDPEKVRVTFASAAGAVTVCEKGKSVDFDEAAAKAILSEKQVAVRVELGEGAEEATAWGCDLTYDYVKINGDYRT